MKAVEELKAALAAATPGELYADEERFCKRMESIFEHGPVLGVCAGEKAKANAHLIALMHNTLPALIECVEALKAVLEQGTAREVGTGIGMMWEEPPASAQGRAALAKLEKAK